ncbi:hypothetical protein VTK26DRAFT_6314 [Humicola hyalothermophila]
MDSPQPSIPSEEHGQIGSLGSYAQILCGIGGEGSPTTSLKPETPCTFTQPTSPRFHYANTDKASSDGSYDSELHSGMFPVFLDDKGDSKLALGPENRENIAPKEQLTMAFTLPDTYFTHTVSIFPDQELQQSFTLPGFRGDIVIDLRIHCVKQARTDRPPPSRQPLGPRRGIRGRYRQPRRKMRRSAPEETDRPSAAETKA